MAGRILAVDWGEKRIGLALSDPMRILASPFDTVPGKPREKLIELLGRLIEDQQVTLVIVGLPRNMDGSEGKSAIEARKLAEQIEAHGVPVELVDERLSSYSATQLLQQMGRKPSRKKELVDRAAAAIFLQEYLDELSARGI